MRYYIQRDFPSLFDFDNLFNDFFESSSDRFPPVDVFETENSYVIEAEVPGYNENDIKIYCKNKILTISSDAVEKKREEGFITEEIALPENYSDRVRITALMKRKEELEKEIETKEEEWMEASEEAERCRG